MMSVRADRWKVRRLSAHALVLCAAAMASAMFVWPQLATVLPACPIHERFGVLCPGCGGTRAMLALLHGDISKAFHFNALLVFLLPAALGFAAESYRRAISAHTFAWPRVPAVMVYGLIAVECVFGVLRNLG
jgi:hypothetical protein